MCTNIKTELAAAAETWWWSFRRKTTIDREFTDWLGSATVAVVSGSSLTDRGVLLLQLAGVCVLQVFVCVSYRCLCVCYRCLCVCVSYRCLWLSVAGVSQP